MTRRKLGIVDQSPVPNLSDARAAVASTLELVQATVDVIGRDDLHVAIEWRSTL